MLKETGVDFLENTNGNTVILIGLLSELEITNRANGHITQGNMLLIQQRLDEIISNFESTNVSQLILEEAKKQMLKRV